MAVYQIVTSFTLRDNVFLSQKHKTLKIFTKNRAIPRVRATESTIRFDDPHVSAFLSVLICSVFFFAKG